ncbi:MAG: hypothetical protein ACRDMY_04955 [Gaiellaceae bacterium]
MGGRTVARRRRGLLGLGERRIGLLGQLVQRGATLCQGLALRAELLREGLVPFLRGLQGVLGIGGGALRRRLQVVERLLKIGDVLLEAGNTFLELAVLSLELRALLLKRRVFLLQLRFPG